MHKPPSLSCHKNPFPRAICLSSAHLFVIVSILEHLTKPFSLILALECSTDLTLKYLYNYISFCGGGGHCTFSLRGKTFRTSIFLPKQLLFLITNDFFLFLPADVSLFSVFSSVSLSFLSMFRRGGCDKL